MSSCNTPPAPESCSFTLHSVPVAMVWLLEWPLSTSTIGSALPAPLHPPTQEQIQRQNTSNSPTQSVLVQNISTKFVHHQKKEWLFLFVCFLLFCLILFFNVVGPHSPLIWPMQLSNTQQWPCACTWRWVRTGQACLIFPSSPLPDSNHFQLRAFLETDVICHIVMDHSSKYLPSLPFCACKTFCNYHTLWQRLSQIYFVLYDEISLYILRTAPIFWKQLLLFALEEAVSSTNPTYPLHTTQDFTDLGQFTPLVVSFPGWWAWAYQLEAEHLHPCFGCLFPRD